MSFHVGQQVVCVNDEFSRCAYWRAAVRSFPKLKSIYTIRSVREVDEVLGLTFYEIVNPRLEFAEGFVEPAFNSRNFRPVRKTSIAVFEALLTPTDAGVAA